ncbi:hypothetical protein NSA19_01910 [Actinomyces bowdenii]|uniref:hypothetical protein n=1 Tax=Actinomyces bowdenii TaxID=131109 RepID=UPI00214D0EB1|nr:hypothetical protein [Actinomyces bowdenii]MCR2051628.1 hypothetical protein [Actinomyces bowdenii]
MRMRVLKVETTGPGVGAMTQMISSVAGLLPRPVDHLPHPIARDVMETCQFANGQWVAVVRWLSIGERGGVDSASVRREAADVREAIRLHAAEEDCCEEGEGCDEAAYRPVRHLVGRWNCTCGECW